MLVLHRNFTTQHSNSCIVFSHLASLSISMNNEHSEHRVLIELGTAIASLESTSTNISNELSYRDNLNLDGSALTELKYLDYKEYTSFCTSKSKEEITIICPQNPMWTHDSLEAKPRLVSLFNRLVCVSYTKDLKVLCCLLFSL